MSLREQKVGDLTAAAESLGVKVEDGDKKEDILARYEEAGVSYEDYKNATEDESADEPEPEPEPAKEESPKQVLVKMERNNHQYQVGEHVFTKAHPFVVMDADEANTFVTENEGFKIASPSEAENFYS